MHGNQFPRMHITHSQPPPVAAAVISAFREGSERAFNQIFMAYDARLMKYASSICVTREDAEEVVQDVFTSLWENRAAIVGTDITGWLIRVCRNKALKLLRRRVFQADITGFPESPSGQMTPLEQLYFDEIEKHINKIIQQLPPARKKIFLLHREEGRSYQQIADELGISVFTVKKQVSLALDHLRTKVTPYACSLAVILLPDMLN